MMIKHQHTKNHLPNVVNSANSRAKDELRKSGMLLTVQRWLVALFCVLSIFSAESAQLSTRYIYDEAGNKNSQTDALGHITRWTYSLTNQVTSRTLPDGSSESFSYDSQGNRTSYTDFNGQITRHAYDLNDRLTLTQYPDGRSIKTTYAPSGQIDTVTESQFIAGKTIAKVTRYSYDIMDRLLKVEYPNKQVITYSYDAAGRLLSRSTANGTTRYSYDVMDQLTTVTDAQSGVTSYEYDAAGNKTKKTLANGQYSTYGYNSRRQLTDIRHYRADQSAIAQYQYTFNDSGLRTQVIETQADINNANQNHSRTVNYGYDSLNRLTQETALDPDNAFGGSYSRTYGYDSVGNRSQQIHTQGQAETITTDYQYDANDQLLTETIHSPTATDTINYQYDKNGNLTQKANQNGVLARYRYTPDNKLSQIEQGSMTIRYAYDADGNRIQSTKTDNSQNLAQTTTNYLVDSNFTYPEIVEEQDTQGKLTASHTFSPTGAGDLLSITRANQGTYYASEDALGSLRQLTNTQGKIEAQQQTTAWGEVLPVSNVNQYTDYGYTGERQDPITGLVYLREREYATSTGRFVQRDTHVGNMINPATLNQQVYANSNPLKYTDPTGLFSLAETNTANSVAGVLRDIQINTGLSLLDAAFNPDAANGVMSSFVIGVAAIGSIQLVKLLSTKFLAKCMSNSFDGDTLVWTKDGKKKIRDILIGEYVLAYNEQEQSNGYYPVTDWIQSYKQQDWTEITTNHGEIIKATGGHPFYVTSGNQHSWLKAKELKIDEVLFGQGVSLLSVVNANNFNNTNYAYNLTVDKAHTYYIGDDGVLVHNASCGWNSIIFNRKHISEGDADQGWHHRPGGIDPSGNSIIKFRKPKYTSPDKPYKAKVIVNGHLKGSLSNGEADSSFFPDSWSPERVEAEIARIIFAKIGNPIGKLEMKDSMGNFTIRVITEKKGNDIYVVTAHPLL